MTSSHFIYRRIALAAIFASVLGSPVRAETRQNLVIRGHVRDESGAPIRDAWVVCKGSRRVAAFVDARGEYRLIIPGGTPAEMSRIPLKLRIQARHKEWTLGLPGGDSELGIEMRMGVDRMGVTYMNVRSNRPEVTSLLASAIGAGPDRPVDVPIDFTGVPSYLSQTPSDTPLELTSELSVDLAGYAHQLPSPSATDAGAAGPRRLATSAMAPAPVRPSASQVAEVLAQPDNEDPLPRASEVGIAGLDASPFAPNMGAADPAQPSPKQLATILAQPDDEDPPAPSLPVFAISFDIALPEPRRSEAGATFVVRPALPSRVEVPPLAGLPRAESGFAADIETKTVPSSQPIASDDVDRPEPTFEMPTSATFPDRPAAATGPLAWAGRSTSSFDGLVSRSPAGSEKSLTAFAAPLIERRMDRPAASDMVSLPLASATVTAPPAPDSSAPVQAPAMASSPTPSATLVAIPPALDSSAAGEPRAPISPPPSVTLVSTRQVQTSSAADEAPAVPVVSGSPVDPPESVVLSAQPRITISRPSPAAAAAPSMATLKPSRGSDDDPARQPGREDSKPVFTKVPTPPDVLERVAVLRAPRGQAVSSSTRPTAMFPPIETTRSGAPVIRNATSGAAPRGTPVLVRPSGEASITRGTPVLVRSSGEASPPPAAPGEISPVPASPPGALASPNDASPSPAGNCRCRVDGTVEVRSNRPLRERTRIAVYAEDEPENRYMVELFMGSPRPFELRTMPCGTHRLMVEVLSGARLNLITTDLNVNCAGGYRPMKIVLEPQRRLSSQEDPAGAAAAEGQTSK